MGIFSKIGANGAISIGGTILLFAGTILYGYFEQKHPYVNPNGLSNFATPSFHNLRALGIQIPVFPQHSAFLHKRGDYAQFRRIYSLHRRLFSDWEIPNRYFKPEFVAMYHQEQDIIRAREERRLARTQV